MTEANALKITADGERSIVMTRSFDAPGHLVFAAFTKPELVKRWLKGPDGWDMPVCEIDLRVGGQFRYVWRRMADGVDMGMGGSYCVIEAPKRIVHTEIFDEDWTGGEANVTTTFVDSGSKTTVTTTVHYTSAAARDAVLKSPMEAGVASSYDRLEGILPDIARKAA